MTALRGQLNETVSQRRDAARVMAPKAWAVGILAGHSYPLSVQSCAEFGLTDRGTGPPEL